MATALYKTCALSPNFCVTARSLSSPCPYIHLSTFPFLSPFSPSALTTEVPRGACLITFLWLGLGLVLVLVLVLLSLFPNTLLLLHEKFIRLQARTYASTVSPASARRQTHHMQATISTIERPRVSAFAGGRGFQCACARARACVCMCGHVWGWGVCVRVRVCACACLCVCVCVRDSRKPPETTAQPTSCVLKRSLHHPERSHTPPPKKTANTASPQRLAWSVVRARSRHTRTRPESQGPTEHTSSSRCLMRSSRAFRACSSLLAASD